MATCDSEKNVVTLLWEIENAILLTSEHERISVATPQFRIRTLKSRKFLLELTPKYFLAGKQYVSLKLFLLSDGFGYPVDIEWSYLGSNGSPIIRNIIRNHYPENDDEIDLYNYPTYNDVFVNRKAEFLKHNTLTIRVRIWRTEGNHPNDEFISSRTRLETVEDSSLWRIPGFSLMVMDMELSFPVTLEMYDDRNNFTWKFSLGGASLEEASVIVHISTEALPRFWDATFKVSLLDNQQNVVKSVTKRPSLYENRNITTWPLEVISRKELLKKASKLLKNDVLTLVCDVSLIQSIYSLKKICFGFPNLKVDMPGVPTFLDSGSQTSEQYTNPPVASLLGALGAPLGENQSPNLNLHRPISEQSADQAANNLQREWYIEDLMNQFNRKIL